MAKQDRLLANPNTREHILTVRSIAYVSDSGRKICMGVMHNSHELVTLQLSCTVFQPYDRLLITFIIFQKKRTNSKYKNNQVLYINHTTVN